LKKFLGISFILIFGSGIAFLTHRYIKNPENSIPYPYIFNQFENSVDIGNAPIIIIGDRLGKRLASFKELIADKISENLSTKVKIIDLTEKGEGLHRTIHKIKQLPRLPLITIYLGGSEEFFEQKFQTKDIDNILLNFKLYDDDRIKTLLMIFPVLSRLLYQNVTYHQFTKNIKEDTNNYSDQIIQKRNIIHFKLFEQELNELFSFVKDKGSYLIALNQPINIDLPPKKTCDGSIDQLSKDMLVQATELIKKRDYKAAYTITKELVLIAPANAKIHYIHGEVSRKLGLLKEAMNSLEMASAYDCKQWHGNPIFNKILTKTALQNEVLVLDFKKIVYDQWNQNVLFMDEIYPQNLYYERASEALAGKIKKLLKL